MKTVLIGLRALPLIAVMLLTGCSGFHSDWRKAGAASPAAHTGISGRWEGTWLSSSNGHTGKLRCVVTPRENDAYEFHYWASFWKVFSYSYKTEFKAPSTNGVYHIQGEKDLGWWAGGVFTHQGTATTNTMQSTYQSRYDGGTFELKRPSDEKGGENR